MNNFYSNTKIFVWHQNKKHGPYSATVISGAINAGKFSPQAPAWTEEDSNWRPLTEVLSRLEADEEAVSAEKTLGGSHLTDSDLKPSKPPQVKGLNIQHTLFSFNSNIYRYATIAGISILLVVFLSVILPTHKKDSPPPSIAQNANTATQCAVFMEGHEGRATGTIVVSEGVYYLYTNVHVASMGNLSVSDSRGTAIVIPNNCEVPLNPAVDLARFRLDTEPKHALAFADRASIEKHGIAFTIGDSDGEGVLRNSEGQVIGVGAQKIEVTCDFIAGNSGGPIVNSEGKLLALASYMKKNNSIWAKGTGMEVRRFGWIPSTNYDWQKTTTDELYQEAKLVEECLDTVRLLMAITYLNTTISGFEFSEKWPIDHISIEDVLVQSEGHPLKILLDNTDSKIRRNATANKRPTNYRVKQEYIDFFKQCDRYATLELKGAQSIIKSGFWRTEFESKLNNYIEISSSFPERRKSYEQSEILGRCLAD